LQWLSVLAGLLFFAGMGLQQMGIVHATVTHTGFLTSLYVVLTPVAVWVILGRAPSFWVWMGVLLAGGGTWLLGGGKGLEGFGLGEALVAVSALFWAVYVVVVGLAAGVRAAMVFTWLQFLVAGVLALIAALILESLTWVGLVAAMPDLLFVGVLSSALMFTLFAAAMEHTGPTETAVIASLEAIFAGLAAWWLLGEMLGILGWIGAAMLVLATLVVHIPAPQEEAE
jgi:drug/metabolite transporter (DMT)-like permease